MMIVQQSFATDRLERAAHAAARAIALNADEIPCAAIRRELALPETFDCEGEWQIAVDRGVSPSDLASLPDAMGTSVGDAGGEMILVRIAFDPAPETEPVAMGIARSEPGAG